MNYILQRFRAQGTICGPVMTMVEPSTALNVLAHFPGMVVIEVPESPLHSNYWALDPDDAARLMGIGYRRYEPLYVSPSATSGYVE